MFVYLLFNGICGRTSRVSLNFEKCVPRVGTYTEGRVDPALWYKVLVLDSILVDCDSRTVFWSCEKCDVLKGHKDNINTEDIRAFFKGKEQMFKGEMCIELDPTLDELFVTSERLFPDILDTKNTKSIYKDLLKILHVYILPHIEFKQNHRKAVRDVLGSVVEEYHYIEMVIKMNVQSKKNAEELLSKQTRQLLTEDGVSGILNNIPKNGHFIKLLLQHTEKNVRQLDEKLSVLCDRITPLRNTAESASLLIATRAERDIVAKEKERMILGREELVNGLIQHRHRVTRNKRKKCFKLRRRSQSVREERITDRFESYKREAAQVENLFKEIKQQINVKVRLSGVREAMTLTLKEIQDDGASYGYNRKKGSLEIEADLFDPTRKPGNWATLSEHVKSYLYSNQSGVKNKHDEFCTRFNRHCNAVQERAERDFFIQFGWNGNDRHTMSFESVPLHQKEAMPVSTMNFSGSVAMEDCEALCTEYSDHILSITDEIVTQIQGNDDDLNKFHSKVYICYEELVAEELMPVLCKLFEQSYIAQCHQLSVWIETYAETELESLNRTLKGMFPDESNRDIWNEEMVDDRYHDRRQERFMESLIDKFSVTSNSLSETFDRTWDFLLRADREEFNDLARSQALNEQFLSAFKSFYATIQEEDTVLSIFSKIQHLTRAVQSAEHTFSDLRTRTGQSSEICTDDILDILILLICKLSPELLLKLYAHVNLILHLSPYFLQGSINEYALVTVTGAFQHLFERQEMHDDSLLCIEKEN